MSAIYGRMRGTEAPMQGLEFTNRPKSIPAWRTDYGEQTTPLKSKFLNGTYQNLYVFS